MTDRRTDAVIVGAQKAATTTLFDMLARSELVAAARPKEPHFFSTIEDWRERLDEYHRIYEGQAGTIRCEASTSYTFFPHRRLGIWHDLVEYNPAIRLIYIVRKPTDRIVSHYRHSIRRGYTKAAIRDFVLNYPLPLAICRYHTQIAPYIETHGRDRVLLLDFDEVVSSHEESLAKVALFLGLDASAFAGISMVHSNSSAAIGHHRLRSSGPLGRAIDRLTGRRRAERAAAAALPPDLARAIIRELELETSALEKLMDRDFSAWRSH